MNPPDQMRIVAVRFSSDVVRWVAAATAVAIAVAVAVVVIVGAPL